MSATHFLIVFCTVFTIFTIACFSNFGEELSNSFDLSLLLLLFFYFLLLVLCCFILFYFNLITLINGFYSCQKVSLVLAEVGGMYHSTPRTLVHYSSKSWILSTHGSLISDVVPNGVFAPLVLEWKWRENCNFKSKFLMLSSVKCCCPQEYI